MQRSERNPFQGGLYIEEPLPLHWRKQDVAPQSDSEAVVRVRNQQLLRLLNLLDEREGERPESENGNSDTYRLEIKMDMVIGMLAELLGQRQLKAPVVPVRLAANGIEWLETGPDTPETGSQLEISLFLDARLPSPLRLRVQVVEVVEEDNGSSRTRAVISLGGETEQELLERVIFRRHRRQIAEKRSSTKA